MFDKCAMARSGQLELSAKFCISDETASNSPRVPDILPSTIDCLSLQMRIESTKCLVPTSDCSLEISPVLGGMLIPGAMQGAVKTGSTATIFKACTMLMAL